jgi:hypothetical protein
MIATEEAKEKVGDLVGNLRKVDPEETTDLLKSELTFLEERDVEAPCVHTAALGISSRRSGIALLPMTGIKSIRPVTDPSGD